MPGIGSLIHEIAVEISEMLEGKQTFAQLKPSRAFLKSVKFLLTILKTRHSLLSSSDSRSPRRVVFFILTPRQAGYHHPLFSSVSPTHKITILKYKKRTQFDIPSM